MTDHKAIKTRCLALYVAIFFSLVHAKVGAAAQATPAARPYGAPASEQVVNCASPKELWSQSHTLQFLSALKLERATEPSWFCHHLYTELDETLDELVDCPLWHRVLSLYVRSALPATLKDLRRQGCVDDLGVPAIREPLNCCVLRTAGRNEVMAIEHAPLFVELFKQPALQHWLATIQEGEERACLQAPEAAQVQFEGR